MPQPPWAAERGIAPVLGRWLESSWVRPCFCADETLGGAEARHAPLPQGLGPGVARALRARGIRELYRHQGQAIEAALAGRHVVVATPTASGKSL
jgi:DEAD/DEAH box helicase domain-containing protein